MAVRVTVAGAEISIDAPSSLFDLAPFRVDDQPPSYDVAADGRFVTLKGTDNRSTEPARLVVVLNWAEQLRKSEPR